MKDIFESKRSMEILLVLLKGKMSVTDIKKNIMTENGNYPPHGGVIQVTNKLVGWGLVGKEKVGRKSMISLTYKGELIARLLEKIRHEIE